MTANDKALIPSARIEGRILLLRGHKVMLDADLAELYGVSTKRFNEQVRRNLERFPADFMFSLTEREWTALRSQFATLKTGRGQHRKYLPLQALASQHHALARNTRAQLKHVFDALRELMTPPEPPKRPIGFVPHKEKPKK